MESEDLATPVPEAVVEAWGAFAAEVRFNSFAIDGAGDPRPGSTLRGDDDAYRWSYVSDAVHGYLRAALDHMVVWANIVAPTKVYDGMEVRNPPRAYYTLFRAALESAAQAAWILAPDERQVRLERHLLLLWDDLREQRKASQARGDSAAVDTVTAEIKAIEARSDGLFVLNPKTRAPTYHDMLRASTLQPDGIEYVWRAASAAAHGKPWFVRHSADLERGDEYEPGRFRVRLHHDPVSMTEALEWAAGLTNATCRNYYTAVGCGGEPLQAAMYRVVQERTPKKGAEAAHEQLLRKYAPKGS